GGYVFIESRRQHQGRRLASVGTPREKLMLLDQVADQLERREGGWRRQVGDRRPLVLLVNEFAEGLRLLPPRDPERLRDLVSVTDVHPTAPRWRSLEAIGVRMLFMSRPAIWGIVERDPAHWVKPVHAGVHGLGETPASRPQRQTHCGPTAAVSSFSAS